MNFQNIEIMKVEETGLKNVLVRNGNESRVSVNNKYSSLNHT